MGVQNNYYMIPYRDKITHNSLEDLIDERIVKYGSCRFSLIALSSCTNP